MLRWLWRPSQHPMSADESAQFTGRAGHSAAISRMAVRGEPQKRATAATVAPEELRSPPTVNGNPRNCHRNRGSRSSYADGVVIRRFGADHPIKNVCRSRVFVATRRIFFCRSTLASVVPDVSVVWILPNTTRSLFSNLNKDLDFALRLSDCVSVAERVSCE